MYVQRYVCALFGGFRSVCWTMNGWSIEGTASSESFIWTLKTNSLRFATLLCTSALWSESLKESRSPRRFTNKCFEVSFDSVQVNALIFPPKKWFGNRSDRIAHERRILLEVTTWCFWLNSTVLRPLKCNTSSVGAASVMTKDASVRTCVVGLHQSRDRHTADKRQLPSAPLPRRDLLQAAALWFPSVLPERRVWTFTAWNILRPTTTVTDTTLASLDTKFRI